MSAANQLLKSIKVFDCSGKKVRIGNNSDGGYIALDEICKNTKTLISFGVEDNVTFEIDFAKKYPNASVILYDHTVDNLPEMHENFCFIKKGVSHETKGQYTSISDILRRSTSNVTIKMDIEWDEWKVFESMSDEDFEKIDQLLVEMHFALVDTDEKFIPNQNKEYKLTPYFCNFYKTIYNKINDDLMIRYKKIIDALNEKFYAFHIHPNNSLKKISYNNLNFPPLLELSFVKKDLIDSAVLTKQRFPVDGLDFPNKPYKPELKNYYPLIEE